MDINKEGVEYIILGTNLTETIVGAQVFVSCIIINLLLLFRASGIAGHKVLHLDNQDRYGGPLSNFNLAQFRDFVEKKEERKGFPLQDFRVLTPLQITVRLPEVERCKFPTVHVFLGWGRVEKNVSQLQRRLIAKVRIMLINRVGCCSLDR